MAATQLSLPDDRRRLYTMTAVPTEVDGVRYDSRLEARRVIWFQQMGIRFRYHPPVERVGYGKLYQPDFFLTDFGVYVEIKPYFDVAFLERTRPLALYGVPILTIFGVPGDPQECASLQEGCSRFDGGRLLQCAAMKTEKHRPLFCSGLVLYAEHGITSFVVRVGHHNHAKLHYVDSDEAHDRDVTRANNVAAAETFDAEANAVTA